MTDADVALQLCLKELEEAKIFASDRRMTRSLQDADQQDADTVFQVQIELPPQRDCVACGEQWNLEDIARAPCQHEYCRDCLERLYRDSMVDETLFPPRCCRQTIPLDENVMLLPESVVDLFRKKSIEFSTSDRTYCHQPQCSTFVPYTACNNDIGTCPDCGAQTCTICKGASHSGDCPHDEQLQQVLGLARTEGWQRCQDCRTMVELNIGCNHISCRCGAQFCYNCGTRWKECQCDQWDERRLLERANQIDATDHANVGEPLDGQQRAANPQADIPQEANLRDDRVERLVQNLRRNHECDHEHWMRRRGVHVCEECNDEMPIFIYECRQCQILACRRCRHNRL
ncbi:IBR finger domain-containing protein [Xylariales sp. AK1849]|nr:IBR finger domain-containing protein [Xylariales sp. AK1849]